MRLRDWGELNGKKVCECDCEHNHHRQESCLAEHAPFNAEYQAFLCVSCLFQLGDEQASIRGLVEVMFS